MQLVTKERSSGEVGLDVENHKYCTSG